MEAFFRSLVYSDVEREREEPSNLSITRNLVKTEQIRTICSLRENRSGTVIWVTFNFWLRENIVRQDCLPKVSVVLTYTLTTVRNGTSAIDVASRIAAHASSLYRKILFVQGAIKIKAKSRDVRLSDQKIPTGNRITRNFPMFLALI